MAAPTASDATRASDFTSAVLAHTYRNYAAHLPRILPWLGLWFGLHALIEFVVPAVWPRAFDALGRDGKLATARERNRDARTKVIAIVQALFVSSLPALWGRFVSGEYARLKSDMFAASPLTMALAEANVAYFTWDIFVCWYDRLTLEWHVHAWLAFLAFTLALVRASVAVRVEGARGRAVDNWAASHRSRTIAARRHPRARPLRRACSTRSRSTWRWSPSSSRSPRPSCTCASC